MAEWTVQVHSEVGTIAESALAELERAARTVLEAESAGDCELSIALVGDEEMTRLNRDYLGHDRPTDVISFPLEQPATFLVGDVYVGLDQARRQAEEYGVQLDEELVRLVVHGVLHVLGWEHKEGDGGEMCERQEALVLEVRGTPGERGAGTRE
jgi:probable rRNA maturation factor